MQNSPFRFGPLALTATYTTNILNPPTTTGGVNGGARPTYLIIKHIRIVNKTAGPVSFRLFLGATGANAAGTEVIGFDKAVAANDVYDWYGQMKIQAADFLVGAASALTSLTIQGEGEIGVDT